MSYAILESYTNTTANVRIGGLEHPARLYDGFVIYLDGTKMGWRNPTSSSDTHEAYVQFDLSKTADGRTTANGVYHAQVCAIWNGVEYNVPFSSSSRIEIDKGGGYQPKPQVRQMTSVKITEIEYANSDSCKFHWKCNGYGTLFFLSATRQQQGEPYIIESFTVDADDIESDGWCTFVSTLRTGRNDIYGRAIYESDLTKFGNLPLGTVQVVGEYNSYIGTKPATQPFLSISQYGFTTYNGYYPATIQYQPQYGGGYNYNDPRVAVANFRGLTEEWTTLVNLFYYLEATTYGKLKYSTYSSYIPSSGHIITASMYNSLMESAESCARQCGVWTSFPPRVESGQIIPRDFISKLGSIANSCIEKQKDMSNQRAIEY